MRIYHFGLVFIIVTVLLFGSATAVIYTRQQAVDKEAQYKKVLDNAATACAQVVSSAGAGGVYSVRDEAIEAFFRIMSLGILGCADAPAAQSLELRVPFVMICGEEGYFVRYCDIIQEDGCERFGTLWSDYMPYDEGWPDSAVAKYCDRYNKVVGRLGMETEYSIPLEEGLFQRSGADCGVYALFVGEGYSELLGGRLICGGFARMGIAEVEKYYINICGEGYASERYYHKENCELRGAQSMCFTSCEECAAHGAYACPCCFNCSDYCDDYGRGISNRN